MDNMENLETLEEASEEPKKKRKLYVPLSALVIYLAVASFLATGVNFSKYISTTNGSDSAKVAKFVVTAPDYDTASDLAPGMYVDAHYYQVRSAMYKFSVQSNADTTMYYKVEVFDVPEGVKVTLDSAITKSPQNLTYHLNSDKGNSPSRYGDVTFTMNDRDANGNLYAQQPILAIAPGDTGVRYHTLMFTTQTGETPSAYTGDFKVKVTAYQID
ncbi:MAG: hypothetical protein Q4B31_04375 [Clostridia bacterium]|nr:hypothetical protein [Clostridia bacterium]